MTPPQGMVSPRGPVFKALVERVETPDADTVVVHGKGPSSMLLSLFANGWNMIIPKHISEKDPVHALKTTVIGTGPFKLKEPPTSTLWKYERNPDYFKASLPYLDEMEIHIITDPQAMAAAVLSKRVFWTDAFPHPSLDQDLGKSMVKQNPNLVLSNAAAISIAHLTMQTEKAPFDDMRVRQAISEAIRRQTLAELGKQTGAVGTGTYPAGPWAMPGMREPLIGYGSDMPKRMPMPKSCWQPTRKRRAKLTGVKSKSNVDELRSPVKTPRSSSSY
jgi:peptide/nickel transport system substrate-binding protein